MKTSQTFLISHASSATAYSDSSVVLIHLDFVMTCLRPFKTNKTLSNSIRTVEIHLNFIRILSASDVNHSYDRTNQEH